MGSKDLIRIYINNIELKVKPNTTILQACEKINVYIPRFCYHDRLSIAGNCRMCLVEVEKSPKPVVSCAFPVMKDMNIYTNTPLVKKARENILEFLLLNHPLDCPICDQGGECDLQDQALLYGSDKSRFYEYKRGVEDKNCGPLIKTIMTRCIHCTRCVRFMEEMTSFKNLGTTNRGNKVEIGTYFERLYESEFSGNIIDLCPVGALTSKPYAFISRPWELKSTNSIDIMDGVGSNIRVDSRGSEVLRILPRFNKKINEEWISDKTRFFFDGLKYQRLLFPLMFNPEKLYFEKISWSKAFSLIRSKLRFFLVSYDRFKLGIKKKGLVGQMFNVGIIMGNLIDIETAISIKKFSKYLGITNVININTSKISADFLEDCTLNENLNTIQDYDLCLIIGSNPKMEASIYNLKLLGQVKQNNLKIYSIGSKMNLNYEITHLGTTLKTLINISEGKHSFCKILRKSKKPLIIYGSYFLNQKNNHKAILTNIKKFLINTKSALKILNSDVGDIAALTLNLKPKKNSLFRFNQLNNIKLCTNLNLIYLVGLTKLPLGISSKAFVIYQGSHGNEVAQRANLILPSKSLFEKTSTFFNIEGRIQKSPKVLNNIYSKKDSSVLNNIINSIYKDTIWIKAKDYKVLNYIISNFLNKFLYINFNFFKRLNHKIKFYLNILNTKDIVQQNLFYTAPNSIYLNKVSKVFFNANLFTINNKKEKVLFKNIIKLKLENFYMTNILTNSSKILSKCSKALNKNKNF